MAFFDGDEATITLTQFAGASLHKGLAMMASTCSANFVVVDIKNHLRLDSLMCRDFQDIHHGYPPAPGPSSLSPDCCGLKSGSFLRHQSCHPRLSSDNYAQGELGSLTIDGQLLAKQ